MSDTLRSIIIALVIVMGGIGAFIFFNESEPSKMFICIGAVLFIAGLILLLSQGLTMKNIYMPLFPFSGAMMIICFSLMLYSESLDGADANAIVILGINFFFSGVVLAGLYLVVAPHFVHKYTMKIFTLPVDAVCVKINVRNSARHTRYAPVWEYDWNGYKYTNEESKYKLFIFVKAGQVCKLMLDPDDPKDFYRPVKPARILQIIIGSVITFIGILWLVNFNIRF